MYQRASHTPAKIYPAITKNVTRSRHASRKEPKGVNMESLLFCQAVVSDVRYPVAGGSGSVVRPAFQGRDVHCRGTYRTRESTIAHSARCSCAVVRNFSRCRYDHPDTNEKDNRPNNCY